MKRSASLSLAVGCLGVMQLAVLANVKWDGSRTPFVHRIPLYDEDGGKIVPGAPRARPFSARQTCGRCHEYATISRGWHFSAFTTQVNSRRPGQAWVHVVPETGIQVPVSSRGWPHTWKPEDFGLTPWRFTREFGRHSPGGGISDDPASAPDPESRWDVSGRLEINCLGCHNASPAQDMGEWARQIGRENFRWAATAAAGFGEVGGMASRLRETWAPADGANPDDTGFAVPPSVRYDLARFDRKGRILIDIEARPPDRRCLYCHSNAIVGQTRQQVDGDVHSARGIACADCHRHGLDHVITRGYQGQFAGRAAQGRAETSCKGCHYGPRPSRPGPDSGAGRMGAPFPTHRGLPPTHLEKLRCTVCHSEPGTTTGMVEVRTARANRLGIHGAAQWDRDLPCIVEPVLIRDSFGLITPHRMVWPAFWAKLEQQALTPVPDETVAAAATGIIDAPSRAFRILSALAGAEKPAGEPVVIIAGRRYKGNADGGLDVCPARDAAPTEGAVWVWEKDGHLIPVVPESLPEAPAEGENPERTQAEAGILDVLTALNRIAPKGRAAVLLLAKQVFRVNDQGQLEATDRAEGEAARPELVWCEDAAFAPLLNAADLRVIASTVGSKEPLTQEMVASILGGLSKGAPSGTTYAYVARGRLFRLGEGGTLTVSDHAAAEPYAWPLAHDVRPAAQALGRTGCGDCHGLNPPFLFRDVVAQGPLQAQRAAVRPMHELMKAPGVFHRVFGLTFAVRLWFKALLLAASILVAIALVATCIAVAHGLPARHGVPAAGPGSVFWRVPMLITVLCLVGLALTGLGGLAIQGAVTGFTLLLHTAVGGVFAIALSAWSLVRTRSTVAAGFSSHDRTAVVRLVCFWAFIACAWLALVALLPALFGLAGTEAQHTAMLVHKYGNITALVLGLVYAWVVRPRTATAGVSQVSA